VAIQGKRRLAAARSVRCSRDRASPMLFDGVFGARVRRPANLPGA
jgi:hypothetical protein